MECSNNLIIEILTNLRFQMSSICGFFVFMIRVTFLALVVVALTVQNSGAQQLFTRVYGGDSYDSGYEVIETDDNGFLIAGSSGSFDEGLSSQILLMKTDDLGYEQWRKTYGGQFSDQARSMQVSADGNLFIGGFTETTDQSYQVLAMKLTMDGDTLWTRQFGGEQWDFCKQLVALPDGGCALFGETHSQGAGEGDFYLIRLNTNGDTLWTRTYGGSQAESGESISITDEGGFYLTGHTESFGSGKKDVYVVKTNEFGDTIWTASIGGIEDEFAFGSCSTFDGGLVAVGGSFSNSPGEGDFMMYKLDSDGNTVGSRIEDGSTDEYWLDVIEDDANNLITVGYVEDSQQGKEDVRIQRVNQELNFDGMGASRGSAENDRGHDIKITSDNAYILTGVTQGFLGRFDDVYLLKMGFDATVVNPELGVNEITIGDNVYGVAVGPNPFSNETPTLFIQGYDEIIRKVKAPLRVRFYNTVGQVVLNQPVTSGSTSIRAENFTSGIYSYQLVSGATVLATGKAVRTP